MEDKKIQAETGSVNNNQRGHERGKDCEEVLLNDKQQAEINGGNVTCEEWRPRLSVETCYYHYYYDVLRLIMCQQETSLFTKLFPFFCVLKKVTNAVIPTLKKITLTHSASRQ